MAAMLYKSQVWGDHRNTNTKVHNGRELDNARIRVQDAENFLGTRVCQSWRVPQTHPGLRQFFFYQIYDAVVVLCIN